MVDAPERIWAMSVHFDGLEERVWIDGPNPNKVGTEYVRADLYEQGVKRAEENNDRMIDAMDECEALRKELINLQDHVAHADAYQKTAMSNLDRAEKAEAELEQVVRERDEANADRDRWYGSSFEATKRAEAAERLAGARVKALEWEAIDGGNAFRASALIFGWIRIETYTLNSWQVQWSVPGICNILLPSVFDTPDEAKAAAQADYERRILSALAEPAGEAEPDFAGARVVNPRHFDILAEAMAEIKAVSDGMSDQPISDIVQGCIDEIKALASHPCEPSPVASHDTTNVGDKPDMQRIDDALVSTMGLIQAAYGRDDDIPRVAVQELKYVRQAIAAVAEPAGEVDYCPICTDAIKAGDTCASDIELGMCHAACLTGSPVVDLDTGEPTEGQIDTFPFEPVGEADPVGSEPFIELPDGSYERATPPDASAIMKALEASLETMRRYKRAGHGDEVFMDDLCRSIRIAEAALAGAKP